MTRPRPEVPVFPILHPAAILRGQAAALPAQVVWCRRVKAYLEGTWNWFDPETQWPNGAHVDLDPAHLQCTLFTQFLDAQTDKTLFVDIETAGKFLMMIGVTHVPTLRSICFRFRREGGSVHKGTDLSLRARACYDLLARADVPLWFHNGQGFDVPFLLDHGFEIRNYAGDTLLLQRYLFPEFPARLEFVAGFWAWVPPWKYLSGGADKELTDDYGK